MAIKSALITTVNSFYTILVTIAKVKSSLLEIINNFYANVTNETQASNTITSENASNTLLQYNVFIAKQGRKVTIKGNLVNNSANIIGGENSYFFELVNAEYASNLGIEAIGGAPTICSSVSGNNVKVYLYNNKLCVETMGAFEVVYLNFEYLTEN